MAGVDVNTLRQGMSSKMGDNTTMSTIPPVDIVAQKDSRMYRNKLKAAPSASANAARAASTGEEVDLTVDSDSDVEIVGTRSPKKKKPRQPAPSPATQKSDGRARRMRPLAHKALMEMSKKSKDDPSVKNTFAATKKVYSKLASNDPEMRTMVRDSIVNENSTQDALDLAIMMEEES
ncbi:MAG: hypothetical protein SGARI_003240 [Bacillariaceae sp.]